MLNGFFFPHTFLSEFQIQGHFIDSKVYVQMDIILGMAAHTYNAIIE